MEDPTYDRNTINSRIDWKLAFKMSEFWNDEAPIGWGKYIRKAQSILENFVDNFSMTSESEDGK